MSRSSHPGASRRRLVFLCGIVPVFIVAVLALYRPPFLARLDDSVYDTVLRSARTQPPGSGIVIVDLDERSLSTLGQWPWPRDLVARLIAGLRDLGASTIAMDVVFAEPDRYASGCTAGASPDQTLADTLRAGDVILGYGFTFDPGGNGHGACVLHPIALPVLHPPTKPTVHHSSAPPGACAVCRCSPQRLVPPDS